MIPVDKVREIIKKHGILEKELSSGAIRNHLPEFMYKVFSKVTTKTHAKDVLAEL